MSASKVSGKGDANKSPSLVRKAGNPPLFGRKSILLGMLTSGFVVANAAQASTATAATPTYAPNWAPATGYLLGQQIISPNNDVVSAKVAHTSSTVYSVDAAKWSVSTRFVQRDTQVVSVKDYGAVGDGVADDGAAIRKAYAAAVVAKKGLFFPGGTYLADAPALVVSGVDSFSLNMDGRLKRKNNSTRDSLIYLSNSTNVRVGTIRTDGNVANNFYGGYAVDEVKEDVRIDNCVGVSIDAIDSINPAGDSLYVAGGVANNSRHIQIGTVSSISDALTGRNAVSIIKGSNIQVGKILSINTGHPGNATGGQIAMPSGLDLEPNSSTDTINNVQVDSLIVTSAGGGGLCVYSTFGQIITNVSIGRVEIQKLKGCILGSQAVTVMGAAGLTVGSIHHTGEGVAAGATVDQSSNVTMDMNLTNCGGIGLLIGATAALTDFRLTGSIRGATSHCVVIYAADRGVIDMTLKNPANGCLVVNKNSGPSTSSGIVFSGDWSKGTTGSVCVGGGGVANITNWLLDGVDFTGWVPSARVNGGQALQSITSRHCLGRSFSTAAPTWDTWKAGDIIWNTTPAAGGVPGWICVKSGVPGTWKAMGVLST